MCMRQKRLMAAFVLAMAGFAMTQFLFGADHRGGRDGEYNPLDRAVRALESARETNQRFDPIQDPYRSTRNLEDYRDVERGRGRFDPANDSSRLNRNLNEFRDIERGRDRLDPIRPGIEQYDRYRDEIRPEGLSRRQERNFEADRQRQERDYNQQRQEMQRRMNVAPIGSEDYNRYNRDLRDLERNDRRSEQQHNQGIFRLRLREPMR